MNRSSTLFDQSPAAEAAIEPHSSFLARAASAREAGNDREAELALGAYLTLRAVDRAATLGGDATPDVREGFRFQAQAALRFVGQLPKVGLVEASHLEGIARALTELDEKGECRLRINLLAYSWHLEQAGQVEEALDALAASEPFYRSAGSDELTNLGMTAGRFHRTLAQWEFADRGYALGYDSAEARQDVRGMLLARLGRAKVLLGRGNLPEARRQMEVIIAEAEGKELADARAWAYADLAVVFEKLDMPRESLSVQYEAFCHFRDSQERCRALGNLGASLRNLGAFNAARIAFETVLRTTDSWYLRTNALVELAGIHGELGDELAFRRYWREAEGEKQKMPPTLRVDFGFRIGRGLIRFGKVDIGRRWLEEARSIAQAQALNEWYFRLEHALESVEGTLDVRRADPARATDSLRDIARIESGLSNYAAALAR